MKRQEGCDYCWSYLDSTFQTGHTLYEKVGDGENAPYITIDMSTGANQQATMMFQSASENIVNRATLNIQYCPYCGRRIYDIKKMED